MLRLPPIPSLTYTHFPYTTLFLSDGWASILRQDTLVRKFGGNDVRLAPAGGCPGPVVVDLGVHVRLIAMDTQWWLHNDVKPYGDSSPRSEEHKSELQSLMRNSYAVFGLNKKNT